MLEVERRNFKFCRKNGTNVWWALRVAYHAGKWRRANPVVPVASNQLNVEEYEYVCRRGDFAERANVKSKLQKENK